ncbi:phytase [uncultured Paraglaciecola sp.]|uniref:phytase n=1 Tax=uncultured Paraglaciecola sp. TaxID=1765024 RepID=UPI00259921AB|nr:phytase [uncultured Paraglaciecola sp.]
MKYFICLTLAVLVSACQSPAIDALSVPLNTLHQNSDIAGKVAKPIRHKGQDYWLLTSEKLGVLLTDQNGKKLSSTDGNIELLDWRDNIQLNGETFGLIAALDSNLGQVLIIKLDWQTLELSEITRLPKTSAQIESLCWYLMPQGHLSLFTADTLGEVAQRTVVDGSQQQLTDLLIQTFIGTPQTKSCVVDDTLGYLYLAEENIGVWRYLASHESELSRELVIATDPNGPVMGEITHLDILPSGELLVTAPEQKGVWIVDTQNNNQAQFVILEGSHKPESVSAVMQQQSIRLGVFDDETGQYNASALNRDSKPLQTTTSSMQAVTAYAETTPVNAYGDAADDPAIWINFADSGNSRVLGTNKKQGLLQYDLQGQLLKEFNVGRVNNVDVRYGMKFNGKRMDIATASNRSTKSISVFTIEPKTGELAFLSDIKTDIDDVYGLCMYQNAEQYYVFINGTDGHYQQYLLKPNGDDISGLLVREFSAPSQPEGCVVDDQNQQLYYGEEAVGVWQVSAEPIDAKSELIIKTNEIFVADVEGLSIYRYKGQRFLIASSQGNDSYGVFALDDKNKHLGSFKIDMDITTRVDGASETDGLAVTSYPLGAQLPQGLLVVQDGRNRLPTAPQNFKLVDGLQLQGLLQSWLEKL